MLHQAVDQLITAITKSGITSKNDPRIIALKNKIDHQVLRNREKKSIQTYHGEFNQSHEGPGDVPDHDMSKMSGEDDQFNGMVESFRKNEDNS